MNKSFAQIRLALCALPVAAGLAACASLPPPTAELSAAQQALNRADGADADQYAADVATQARRQLSQAQAAMAAGREAEARALALRAAADADLAYALGRARITRQEYRQRRDEVAGLRQRLRAEDDAPAPALADIEVETAIAPGSEALRLQRLEADAGLAGFADYERLRARTAVQVAVDAPRRTRADAQYLAGRRVAVAELAARTEAMRRQVDALERDRGDLLVEASRQDAERARQEAERLRVEAQIQAEETQRLRAEAEAAALARQQAEDLVIDVGGNEAEKLKATRAREAELARQEAELMGEAPEPPRKERKPRK